MKFRLQAHLTYESEMALRQLLASVNVARAKAGMEPVTISLLVNEMISRVDEMQTVNLCGVFLMDRRADEPLPLEPIKRDFHGGGHE
jgi:hypothetical protein